MTEQTNKKKTYSKTNTSPFALTSEWRVIINVVTKLDIQKIDKINNPIHCWLSPGRGDDNLHVINYPPFARRAKGEVFVLLLLFCSFFCQRFLDNPRANLRQILHAGVLWFRMCLLPFWGLAAPGGRKKGEMNFFLLWESMGNFCILAVFERYLSNACTDPHQILFV